MRQLWLGLPLLLLAGLIRASLGLPWPFCEDVLQPGQGFGGAVTITHNCLWRPQVHFVATITGRLDKTDGGALAVPTIALASADIVETSSGGCCGKSRATLGSAGVAAAWSLVVCSSCCVHAVKTGIAQQDLLQAYHQLCFSLCACRTQPRGAE